MSKQPENSELNEQSLSSSIKDGASYAVMENSGNAYVVPFALACGAGNTFIGLLSSLPLFISSLFQMRTPRLMENYRRKFIVIRFVLLQAFMWLPMILLALINVNPAYSLPLLLLVYVTLISFNSATTPAWNSWMKDLVSDDARGRYFGKRSSIAIFMGISAMLVSGLLLDIFKKESGVFFGFALLFGIAFIARLFSAHFLGKQHEPEFKLNKGYYFSFADFVKKMLFNNFGRFTAYVALFHFSVNIAGPFFAVYMLKHLKFSYTEYTSVVVASAAGIFISMPLWGKINDRYGSIFSLRIAGFLVPAVPVLWLFSANVCYLATVEFLSGLVWGAFNLSTQNFIHDAVSKERIGLCVSYLNVIQTVLIFIGATLGGLLSTHVDLGIHPVLALFIISGSARLIVSLSLLPRLKEVKAVRKFALGDIQAVLKTIIY